MSASTCRNNSENHPVDKMNFCLRNLLRFPPRTIALRSKMLECSKGPETKLPKLPVPPLQATLTKFLKSAKPFLDEDQYCITEKRVKDFGAPNGVGALLQQELECRFKEKDNWLEEWWLQTAYFGFRFPVTFYSSPGLVFPYRKFKDFHDQLVYTSRVITAAVEYKLKIDCGDIRQEKMGGKPLDMSQYKKIFGTTRIPKIPYDELRFNPDSKHIVVIHNNRFFKMEVLSKEGIQLSDSQIRAALIDIIECSCDPGIPIGILTSWHRDKWSEAYEDLLDEECNKEALNEIFTALFTLSIDKCCYKPQRALKCEPEHMVLAGIQTVTGGGPEFNGGNRWYDKTIQFIVDSDGHNGLTYEHSPAEGQPIAVMMDHIVKYVDNFKEWTVEAVDHIIDPTEIRFKVNDRILQAVEHAKKDLDQLNQNIDMECFKFECYGKEFIKSQKMSPDSFIQMAIQLAFYRIHKTPGSHYESAATRLFYHGRTETIRSCSCESIEFCNNMLDDKVSNEEKVKSLRKAVTTHKDYTIQAIQGLGVDRHFLGLRMIALQSGIELPDLYSDPGFIFSSPVRISTSQVASLCDGFMVYGPIVEDGYACCYNPRKNDINFGTSVFKSSPVTSAEKWRIAITKSLTDMQNLLVATPQAKL